MTLRLRVSRDTFAWWRGLEAQARRWLPRGVSWLRFLCLAFWQGWRHLIRASGTAEHIRWELGPRGAPCVVVHGRERMVA